MIATLLTAATVLGSAAPSYAGNAEWRTSNSRGYADTIVNAYTMLSVNVTVTDSKCDSASVGALVKVHSDSGATKEVDTENLNGCGKKASRYASWYIHELGNPRRVTSRSQFAVFAGLAPAWNGMGVGTLSPGLTPCRN
jgi:hypothetical protein